MRNVAIFSGSSHTFGLGLEIEFRDKYNDDYWLKENGLMLPLPREKEDLFYWRKYRWPKLLCDDLGLIEYNIHDEGNIPMGGNSIETLWFLTRDENQYYELFQKTKYVFLEMGHTRWWDSELHGKSNNYEYPHTIREIIDLINNPKSDNSVVAKALKWINDFDEEVYWSEALFKFKKLKSNYPEIKFVLIPWSSSIIRKDSDIFSDWVDMKGYHSMSDYFQINKLRVCDVAKGFNGQYKYTYKDDHAGSLGNRHAANIIINHLNGNEDLFYYKLKNYKKTFI